MDIDARELANSDAEYPSCQPEFSDNADDYLDDEQIDGSLHQHHHDSNHAHSHGESNFNVHHTHSSHEAHSTVTEKELEEERQHFQTVKAAFRYYRKHCFKKIARQSKTYLTMSQVHRDKVPALPGHLDALRQCADVNYQFILRILEQIPFDEPGDERHPGKAVESDSHAPPVGSFHMDKVHTTLRMFMRDWSAEGALEREQAYHPLLEAIKKYVPITGGNGEFKVLNPGSGLGRLPWELARLGYASIGNEFSLYMLFASNFVLNCCTEAGMFKIYPWIGQASNNMTSADKLAGVLIPDVSPARDLAADHRFGMVAGDFLEVFARDACWSAVVTCFFIDTARNIVDYIEHIFGLLQPGAFWLNLGPLLYHFADRPQEACTELTYEELKEAIIRTGFIFFEEKCDIPCLYVQNCRSMLRSEYRCVFFVCQKPLGNGGSGDQDF